MLPREWIVVPIGSGNLDSRRLASGSRRYLAAGVPAIVVRLFVIVSWDLLWLSGNTGRSYRGGKVAFFTRVVVVVPWKTKLYGLASMAGL